MNAFSSPAPLALGMAKPSLRQCPPVQRVPVLLPALLLACSAAAQAQAPTNAPGSAPLVATLATVVVSGSRDEQLRDELPVSMDVFEASELQDRQINDIHDLAQQLPNVSVRRAPPRFTVTGAGNPTGRDGNAGFNIRGLGGNRVLMLVDGIRLPHSYLNGNNAFGRDTLSLSLLKRIELVRGPSSVLYGSDGLAGLVNFITHEPADFLLKDGDAPARLGGRAAIAWSGEDRGLGLSATVAGRASESVEWLLTATTRHDSGVDNRGDNDAPYADRTTPNPQTQRSASLLGKLVFRPQPGQKHVLTLEHAQKDNNFELFSSRTRPPLLASSVIDESATQSMKRDRLTWDARYSLDWAAADQLQTVLSWQDTTQQDDGRTVRRDGGVRLRDTAYRERAWQASVRASKTAPLSAQWAQKISYGIDHVSTQVSSWFGGFDPAPLPRYVPKKYFPDSRESSTGLYVQDELMHERWSITPGLRLERFALDVTSQQGYAPPATTPGKSLSGSNVSPKLGVVYRATPQWSIFGQYASGFRAPDAAQVNGFTENPTPSTFVRLLSNPDLKPETSRNLELGLRGRLERVSLDMAIFSGRFNNLIVDKKPLGGTGVAGDPLVFQTVNVDNATIRGFEIKGSVDWGLLAGGRLSTPFAYGQTRGKDTATGLPLNSIDPSKLVLGVKYQTAQWDGWLDATHHAAKTAGDLDSPYLPKPLNPPRVRQFTTPSAITLDLGLQWRIRKDLRVNVALANLTNRKYWLWSDVQGLAASSPVIDAYTQPGRHANLMVVMDF